MKIIATTLLCAFAIGASAQGLSTDDSTKIAKYRRSSLFTVMITHPGLTYSNEIHDVFINMPTPDKFENHDLTPSLKSFEATAASKKEAQTVIMSDLESYLNDNAIARELVAKWFNRDSQSGTFDMQLVGERGNYDATLSDVSLAEMSVRGHGMLADAGEQLIGNTFVLVSDITYIDKEKQTKKAGGWIRVAGSVAGAFVANGQDIANMAADVTEQFGGFSVKISTHLYRLDWTDLAAATFYQDYWQDNSAPDSERRIAFDGDTTTFKLKYIGHHSTTAGNVAVKGFTQKTDQQMIRMVCTRALDRSIVELQREHDEFKVNVPIHSIDEQGNIFVQIGLKEGINDKSRFEVLEQIETAEGRTEYKKIGVIAPVVGQIWDNRFMAGEEAAKIAAAGKQIEDKEAKAGNVNLTSTQFRKVSGNNFYPGLLVREMTIKTASN